MIFLILIVFIFSLTCLLMVIYTTIYDSISNYPKDTISIQCGYDAYFSFKLKEYYEIICILGVIGWPIYVLFLIGEKIGVKIFNLKVGDNNEDRIASWFV